MKKNFLNSKSGKTDSVNISEKWFVLVPSAAKRHLLNSLRSLERHAPPTPSFPLYGKSDFSVVTDFLNSDEVKSTHPPKWLLKYELSRESKYGGQGGHAPWKDLRDDAKLYFTRPVDSHYQPAAEDLERYSRLRLLKLSAQDALRILKNEGSVLSRANGWRLFNLKKTDETAQRDAIWLIRTKNWRLAWAYFFSRFNKRKKRLFVPMPFCINIMQAQWGHSFLRAIQDDLRLKLDKSEFTFWGDKIGFVPLFLQIMTPKVQGLDPNKLVYVVRDFEKMDTSMGVSQKTNSWVSRVAAAYHMGKDSQEYRDMAEIMLFSNKCPIATPDGMWTGDHGEASGAYVTNMGETTGNEDFNTIFRKLLLVACQDCGLTIRVIVEVGNGDDGLSILYLEDTKRFDELKELIATCANRAASICGFYLQGEKWDVTLGTYGKYCQYLTFFDNDMNRMRMWYPASLILNAICNPEDQYAPADWDKDYRDCDIIAKLNNGWDLPYFHALVDYVDNGMKFGLLGRTETETRRILSKWDSYVARRNSSWRFNITTDKWNDNPWDSPVVKYLAAKRHYSGY